MTWFQCTSIWPFRQGHKLCLGLESFSWSWDELPTALSIISSSETAVRRVLHLSIKTPLWPVLLFSSVEPAYESSTRTSSPVAQSQQRQSHFDSNLTLLTRNTSRQTNLDKVIVSFSLGAIPKRGWGTLESIPNGLLRFIASPPTQLRRLLHSDIIYSPQDNLQFHEDISKTNDLCLPGNDHQRPWATELAAVQTAPSEIAFSITWSLKSCEETVVATMIPIEHAPSCRLFIPFRYSFPSYDLSLNPQNAKRNANNES
jgi:hypothetical protein